MSDSVADQCARFLPRRWLFALLASNLLRLRSEASPVHLERVDRLLEAVYRRAVSDKTVPQRSNPAASAASFAEALVINAERGEALPFPDQENAGPLWANDTPLSPASREPVSDFAGERTLIVGLQGTDARRALPLVAAGKAAFLGLGVQREPALPEWVDRLDRGRYRAFNGYPENEDVRAAIDTALARLATLLPAPADALARRHAVALSNQLMTDCDRFVLQCVDTLEHVRRYGPDRILILEGDQPADHLVSMLAAAGFPMTSIGIICGAYRLAPMLEFRNRRFGTAPTDGAAPSAVRDAFAKSIEHARIRLGRLTAGGKSIVMAATNARHFGAATAVIRHLGRHWPVEFLVPANTVDPSVVRAAIALFWQSLWRTQSWIIRSHATLIPVEESCRWSRPIGQLLRESLASASLPPGLKEAVDFGADYFCATYLAPALAFGDWFERAFRETPPAHVVLIPGTQPTGMLAATAAQATGVPSLQVQTLLTQPNGREYRPVAEWVGVIDSSQAELYTRYFGIDPAHLVLTGYLDSSDRPKPEPVAAQPPPVRHRAGGTASRFRVAFVSQPLPEIAGSALAMLIDAIRSREDIDLIVYAHPREDRSQLLGTDALVEQARLGARLAHVTGGTPWDDVLAADLVACLYSNLGIQAASAGKDLLVIDPTAEGYPCRFDDMGIAVRARSTDEIGVFLDDLRSERTAADLLAMRRRAYFEENPQLTEASGPPLIVETLRQSGR